MSAGGHLNAAGPLHAVRPLHAAVLGAGTMGTGIAQLLLQAGASVSLIDPAEAALERARLSLLNLFERLHAKGRLAEEPGSLLSRLRLGRDHDLMRGAHWVLEAAPEDLDLKRDLFAAAARVEPAAKLATNTSTLSVTAIAAACPDPGRLIGLHFFNPPGLMRLVEVVPGVRTAPELVPAAVELVRRLGREPVVAKDAPGFIVNRLARPFYLEALRLHGEGVPVEAVDAALRGAGFRMGPFELLDLIGIDVNLAASESVYRAFYEEPRFRPHPLQRAMVEAGLLGRKTGRGFYPYDDSGDEARATVAAGSGGSGPGDDGPPPVPFGAASGSSAGPVFHVVGDGSVAAALREALPTTADPATADLVLDARLDAPPGDGVTPRAVLTWGRSAASAGEKLGFSLVPRPGGGTLSIELMAAGALPGEQPTAAVEAARDALEAAGVAVVVLPDVPGGAAFRVVARLCDEAVRALAEGLATAAELDLAMRLGVNYPAGPLEWGEALGLRDVHSALRSLQQETSDTRFAPHPRLARPAAPGAHGSTRGAMEAEET